MSDQDADARPVGLITTEDAKRPVGRPTAYREEYCERVIALGRLGKSKAQIAADLDVTRNTLKNWAAEHPEFLTAMERAEDLAIAWWEDSGQAGMFVRGFNAALWSRSMAARFPADYREERRMELTGAGGVPLAQPSVRITFPTNAPGESAPDAGESG